MSKLLLRLAALVFAPTTLASAEPPAAEPGATPPARCSTNLSEDPIPENLTFEEAKARFLFDADKRRRTLLHPRHAPLLLDHGRRTRYAVVLTSGLYDSPYFQRERAERLYRLGFNVIAPLLPAHWETNPKLVDDASYLEYVRVQKDAVTLAKAMGDKLVLMGHSTGALLAFMSALEEKRTAAVVLFAPAFGVSWLTKIGTAVGRATGLTGNHFLGRADDTVPTYSAGAGEQVRKLIKLFRFQQGWPRGGLRGEETDEFWRETFGKLKAPYALFTSDRDLVIDKDLAELSYDYHRGMHRHYSSEVLGHNYIGRFPPGEFRVRWPADYQMEAERLWERTHAFLANELEGVRRPARLRFAPSGSSAPIR